MTTKAEQETIIRWDEEERIVHLYTAYASLARKWTRLGYSVEVYGRTQAGQPRSWQALAPVDAIRFRRLVSGQIVSRRRGHSFGLKPRKLAAPAERTRRPEPADLGRRRMSEDNAN